MIFPRAKFAAPLCAAFLFVIGHAASAATAGPGPILLSAYSPDCTGATDSTPAFTSFFSALATQTAFGPAYGIIDGNCIYKVTSLDFLSMEGSTSFAQVQNTMTIIAEGAQIKGATTTNATMFSFQGSGDTSLANQQFQFIWIGGRFFTNSNTEAVFKLRDCTHCQFDPESISGLGVSWTNDDHHGNAFLIENWCTWNERLTLFKSRKYDVINMRRDLHLMSEAQAASYEGTTPSGCLAGPGTASFARLSVGDHSIGGVNNPVLDGFDLWLDGASAYDSEIGRVSGNAGGSGSAGGGSFIYIDASHLTNTRIRAVSAEGIGPMTSNTVGIRAGSNSYTAGIFNGPPFIDAGNYRCSASSAMCAGMDPTSGFLMDGAYFTGESASSNTLAPTVTSGSAVTILAVGLFRHDSAAQVTIASPGGQIFATAIAYQDHTTTTLYVTDLLGGAGGGTWSTAAGNLNFTSTSYSGQVNLSVKVLRP
ncbi:MAG TPA: hypothetical protein VGG48_01335 [Rhizomicrobium sp.]|jgi:hypothetical protein